MGPGLCLLLLEAFVKACPIWPRSHVAFGAGQRVHAGGSMGEWKSHTLRFGEEEVEAEKRTLCLRPMRPITLGVKAKVLTRPCSPSVPLLCSVAQWCLTLWDPTDCSPPGSSVHGIRQAIILEWVATPSSRRSSQPRDRTHGSYFSCIGRLILYH
ncbi:unnamed protein product [Rangifer tarandus platyrhynchus]|uniref:Secreted protein n=1 Tax=Rangifer tarandus platyrhynchus TaxID=3082113 RepID=A0ABN8XPL1_RANTA|nr:unnamed protein product [Rangifer tarandus platyrhynchus]